ncbi:hypothetical protein TrVFT333_004152 [Trichoderma virens FT-333]|nr:hypothetical protein TrVFT333_004152 [Trichoderma virens FT-333]
MGWVLNATEAINDESQYPTIITICVVLSVVSIAIVGTRLWIRFKARGLASDDWMSALSVAFALIYSILCIVPYAVVTIVSDIVVAILPLPVLLKLNIQTSKKIDRISHGDGNSTMLVLWGTIEFNVGNMVSSLPFLAPVFMRKAKEYRTKNSYNNGSSHQNSRGGPKGEHFKLSDVTTSQDHDNDKGVIPGGKSSSEENILQNSGIMKSITYSVRVDEDRKQPRRRNDSFEENV